MKKTLILTASFILVFVSLLSLPISQKAQAASATQLREIAGTYFSSNSKADSIIRDGLRYYGTPYRFGAEYPSSGYFDCSSFVRWVFYKNGTRLPRTSRQQAKVGHYVSPSELRKGDLVFTSTSYSNGRIAHVGIYLGSGYLLHTYGPGGVRINQIRGSWLESRYITARRIL